MPLIVSKYPSGDGDLRNNRTGNPPDEMFICFISDGLILQQP
ncbi:MAG: hypothetical protein ACKO5C_05860 [Ferruginibacter sp.]